MPCSHFWILARCCFRRWIPSARLGFVGVSRSGSPWSGIRLVKRAGIAHRSWCSSSAFVSSESFIALSEVSWAAIIASTALRICRPSAARLVLRRDCGVWMAVGGAGSVTQSLRRSCTPSPRAPSCKCNPCGVSHCGAVGLHNVQKQRPHALHFREASTVVPFLVAALAPHSVSFADGPVLKFVLHANVIQTFQIGDRVRRESRPGHWRSTGRCSWRWSRWWCCKRVWHRWRTVSRFPEVSRRSGRSLACLQLACSSASRQGSKCCVTEGVCGSARCVHVFRHAKTPDITCSSGSMACRTSTCHPLARTCVATFVERYSVLRPEM